MAPGSLERVCVSSWPMNRILLKQIYGHGCFLLNNVPRSSQPGLLTRGGQLEGVPIRVPFWVRGEPNFASAGVGALGSPAVSSAREGNFSQNHMKHQWWIQSLCWEGGLSLSRMTSDVWPALSDWESREQGPLT